MPSSNSWRLNGLAGATTAMRSPDRRARGFSMSEKASHFVGDGAMLVAAEQVAKLARLARPRRHGDSQKTFFRPLLPLQRVLDARQAQLFALDRVNQRLQRRGLHIVVGATHEQRVTPGFDSHDGGGRN